MKRCLYILSLAIFVFVNPIFLSFESPLEGQDNLLPLSHIKSVLNKSLAEGEPWPSYLQYENKGYEIHYTFNHELTQHIRKVLNKYSPDYAAVVVLNNNTGEILSTVDYNANSQERFGHKLAFAATHPAASIFKVITASTLLTKKLVNPGTLLSYAGRTTTLFRSQLGLARRYFSQRLQTLKKAFAISNNVIFGKVAIQYLSYEELESSAKKFGFEDADILKELDLPASTVAAYADKGKYGLAEMASGFNRDTQMSPLQAALIPMVAATGGILRYPSLIKEIVTPYGRERVWESPSRMKKSFSPQVMTNLRELMKNTIIEGTAKKAFRDDRRCLTSKRSRSEKCLLSVIDIGGKTGSMTGGEPYGKRDWFVAYAKPQGTKDSGISISVMLVNARSVRVKSSVIARDVIKYWYRKNLQ